MTRDWRVVPIEELRLSELKSLLEQQAAEWRSALFWDFKRTAIHTFFLAELRALTGSALLNADGRAAGYACFEFQGRSAEFTHFYVAPEFRSIDANTCLLSHALRQLTPEVDHIVAAPAIPHQIELGELSLLPQIHQCVAEQAPISHVGPGFAGRKSHAAVAIRPWHEAYERQAAQIIPASYSGHIEAGLDGFDRSVAAAADYLAGVIHFQTTFPFLPEASFVAIRQDSGDLCGFIVAAHALSGVAFANLLCVGPGLAEYRIGNRLTEEHRQALARMDYRTVTLRRRADHRLARFYRRLGFVKQFDQMVYEWRVPISSSRCLI